MPACTPRSASRSGPGTRSSRCSSSSAAASSPPTRPSSR
jgi:hypothetical protein